MPQYFKDRWDIEKNPDCGYEKLLGEVNADNVNELYLELIHFTL